MKKVSYDSEIAWKPTSARSETSHFKWCNFLWWCRDWRRPLQIHIRVEWRQMQAFILR